MIARRTREFWLLTRFCHTTLSPKQTRTGSTRGFAVSLNKNPIRVQKRSIHSFPFKHAEPTSPAAVPKRITSLDVSRVFCVCAWVPRPVRAAVDGQLRASCKMLLTETLFSLCNHDNRGSAHPKFLYRSRNHVGISTNWDARDYWTLLCLSATDGTRFYYGNTPATGGCAIFFVKAFIWSIEWNIIWSSNSEDRRSWERRFSLDPARSPGS